MLIALLWLACSEPDPILDPVRASLEASQRGEALLAAGKPQEAVAAFAEARAHKEHPVLGAWQARAMAAKGEVEPAAALLGEVLLMAPELAPARYNRAAYLARLGRTEDAGVELARAIADGAATAREAAADPDFAGLIGHPDFPFLPVAVLEAQVSVPEGTAFWGSELFVEATVAGAAQQPVQISAPNSAVPLGLVQVVEALEPGEDPVRRITWSLRVEGAGEGELGPWTVTVGGRSTEVAAAPLAAAAPPGKETGLPEPWQWWSPSAIRGEREPPAVWQADGALWALTPPGGRVQVDGIGEPLKMEQRVGSATTALLYRFPGTVPAEQAVRIEVGTELVFSGPPGS